MVAAHVASANQGSAHIADATYNALLSMVVTPSSIPNCEKSSAWKRAARLSLADEEDYDSSLPAAVLDDVLKIINANALSVILDQLIHMSPLVQQRTLQDLFVLLKFEPENRRVFNSIPNWQRTLAGFLAFHAKTAPETGVFEMGIKLWVLVLHDAVLKDGDTILDVFWLGESFSGQISHAVLTGLLECFLQDKTAPIPSSQTIQALIMAGELSSIHYPLVLNLVDSWKRLPELAGEYFALLVRSIHNG